MQKRQHKVTPPPRPGGGVRTSAGCHDPPGPGGLVLKQLKIIIEQNSRVLEELKNSNSRVLESFQILSENKSLKILSEKSNFL